MNTRQTSINCYNQIKAKGLISKRRFEVYQAIYNSAPCTSSEAMIGKLNSTNVLSQSRARFTELRELGVIYEKGIKKCSVTGRNVIEWDLTDRLPIIIKKSTNTKKNELQILKEKLAIAKTSLEAVLWYIITDDCRNMVNKALDELKDK
jgi:hypothetical protein